MVSIKNVTKGDMGLDMYAARRLDVAQWESQPAEQRYSVQIEHGGKPVSGIQSDRISSVDEEVMYWRKANHIHGWFVQNVQNNEDNCGSYNVSWEKLKALLSVCKKVLKASKVVDGMVYAGTVHDKEHPDGIDTRELGKVIEDATVAKELLPTLDGPFFGALEYDEYYLNGVVETRDWIVRMLADRNEGVPGRIVYSSSW